MQHDKEQENGAARLALCEALPEALEAATGDHWVRDDAATFQEDSWTELNDPRGFRGSVFRRVRDSFAVRVTASLEWNKPGRVVARIDWPDDPTERGAGRARRLRDAPGWPYNAREPETTAAANRPTKAVARQIVRELVTQDHADAWAGIVARNDEATQRKHVAGEWRAKVGAALTGDEGTAHLHPSGIYQPQHDSRWRGPSHRTHPVGLDLTDPAGNRPGGVASVELPDDPDAAARIVAAMRAAVLAEKGES